MDNISTIILASSLIIIMLGMGLSLTKNDFFRIFKNLKAISIGLINQLILLPIIAYTLIILLNVNTEIAIGIMILAACPGGPTSNLITHLAKGDTALSVSLTAANSIITIVTIPLVVNFALYTFLDAGKIIELDILKTIMQIFIIVIIPVIIGMIIKNYKPKFADRMDKPVRITSAIVLVLVIVGIILKEKAHIIDYFQQAGIIALILNLVTMTVGYLTSKIFSLSKKQAISISIESGIQNGTMAITIATVLLSSTAYAIAPAVYSIIMFFTGGILIAYGIKTSKSKLSS